MYFLFEASYAGVKDSVPAYLDPTLTIENLMTGVSFASAGTGFDPMTTKLSVSFSISLVLFLYPCLSCLRVFVST